MKYVLIVRTSHLTNGYAALESARKIVAEKNQLLCVYFLFDGVYVANKLIDMPADEINLSRDWFDFATQNNLNLLICAASGMRRGVVAENIASGFNLASIGQLVEACDLADQVVTV